MQVERETGDGMRDERRMRRWQFPALLLVAAMGWLGARVARAQFPEPDGGDLERGTLAAHWATGGPKCMEMPEWQVQEYNPEFFILRQSGCTDFEMPFLYLIFGQDKALLWDTGSRNGDLTPTLTHVVHEWLERNHRASIPLMVMHWHSHDDHTWGDAAVKALHDPAMPIEFVEATQEAEQKAFGIAHWPTDVGQIDLGGRVEEIVPIPGHDVVSVALYDRRTGILLTGDSLYPGRLYVHDLAEFEASTKRLIAFVEGKPVAWVLGNHIEESSTPFQDYPIGSIWHPQEHRLQLSFGDLLALEDGLQSLHGTPRRLAMADFTIWPVTPTSQAMGAKAQSVFDATQKCEQARKWDHAADGPCTAAKP